MYPCLMVFASIQVLNIIHNEAKKLVNIIAECSYATLILKYSTIFYRKLPINSLVKMLLNNV